jgi:MAGUK p55 subfamily member 2/6
VTFRVVGSSDAASARESTNEETWFVQSTFAWSAQTDDLIPCRDAGVDFTYATVLQVIDKSDPDWWQVCLS